MTFNHTAYKAFIEKELMIIDKKTDVVPFVLKTAQSDFLSNITGRDCILKARQLGFSSLILAILTSRFLLKDNQRLVVVSHEADATQRLMDRVKFYIKSFEDKNKTKIALKYNSRSEIVNQLNNSTFYIGTAESKSFGRGDTITGLHLSEFAFYSNPEAILSGVLQALTPDGLCFIESTANGFNFFKDFYDRSVANETGFKTHFYSPSWEYDTDFYYRSRKN